jgi:hypothetical protein
LITHARERLGGIWWGPAPNTIPNDSESDTAIVDNASLAHQGDDRNNTLSTPARPRATMMIKEWLHWLSYGCVGADFLSLPRFSMSRLPIPPPENSRLPEKRERPGRRKSAPTWRLSASALEVELAGAVSGSFLALARIHSVNCDVPLFASRDGTLSEKLRTPVGKKKKKIIIKGAKPEPRRN